MEWNLLCRTRVRLGDTLGSYRIVDVVGQGGMAEVYVGEHVVVRHRVAIKVVHPRHLDNQRMTTRFLNEARAVAAIRHPGIVEFYDLGRADDGRAYIVMELLKGETLASRLRLGPIAPRRAIAFGRQMASALGAAHDCGIVHRDLKPANIFLVPDPDVPFGERAKILDFGIAKHTGDKPLEEVTGTGVVVGTPAHMSPEQCRGDREIDGRSDVYALGVLLYHMVTGRLPFDAGTTGEIVTRHLYDECPPAATVVRAVSRQLSDVIARCMAKDPWERYATMADLAIALADVGDGTELNLDDAETPPPVLVRSTRPLPAGSMPAPPTPPPPTVQTETWVRRPAGEASALTRTIVDQPSALRRLRAHVRGFVLAAVAGLTVAGAVVAALPDPTVATPVAAPAAAAGMLAPVAEHAPPPPPMIEIVEPARAPDADVDERRASARSKRARPRDKARPAPPKPKPAPPKAAKKASPPPAPEDPFASIATPAVY